MEGAKGDLDFAYRYPFSDEAKQVIRELGLKSVDPAQVQMGKTRLEEALESGRIGYTPTSYEPAKRDYLIGYVYARMLVSAMKNSLWIGRYAGAEARRSAEALEGDSRENIARVLGGLGMHVQPSQDGVGIGFVDFLRFKPMAEGFNLANQRLSGGTVMLDMHQLIKVMEVAVRRAVMAGLPIEQKAIPKAVLEASKSVKRPVSKVPAGPAGGETAWIEALLRVPIPDCRHRTVNLILAPYFVTIRGLDVERATQAICSYIELCKTVNPDTKVTERYVKYQCEYAKAHNFRPLSLKRARVELFSSFDAEFLGEYEARAEAAKAYGRNDSKKT